MFCPECGIKCEDGMKFCTSCGAKLIVSSAAYTKETPPEPAADEVLPPPVQTAPGFQQESNAAYSPYAAPGTEMANPGPAPVYGENQNIFPGGETKFCIHCGQQIPAQAVVCVHCGCSVAEETPQTKAQASNDETLALIAKIFLVIGCLTIGWLLIPLIWCLPITISIFGKLNRNEEISTGLKVAALIFVSPISGIILLCMNN